MSVSVLVDKVMALREEKDRRVSEWSLADGLPEVARDWFAVLGGAVLHKPLVHAAADASGWSRGSREADCWKGTTIRSSSVP